MSADGAKPQQLRIGLDAMGGDNAPAQVVAGAIAAAKAYGVTVVLIGKEDLIKTELAKHNTTGLDLPIANATETIDMEEHPSNAVRRKRDSSIMVGMEMLARGEIAGFVSAGNSGAMMAGALLSSVRRVDGIDRPAIATVFPTAKNPITILDVGANTEVKPEQLVQFAQMGAVYAEKVLGRTNAKVGLVSNGEEETKGSQLVQETHQLLKGAAGINFVGNVEGKDIMAGIADVVVTDGFTGNVIIKLTEGVASTLLGVVREELTANWYSKVLAAALRPAFRRVRDRMDYEAYGGAPLLGVNGIVIIAHGRSGSKAIQNAIRVAREGALQGVVPAIQAVGAAAKKAKKSADVS